MVNGKSRSLPIYLYVVKCELDMLSSTSKVFIQKEAKGTVSR
jgi:hypothetical protein